jgi:hypothetical protein
MGLGDSLKPFRPKGAGQVSADVIKVIAGAVPGLLALGWQGWLWRAKNQRKPELSLLLDTPPGEEPPVIAVADAPCAFYRLLIRNDEGKDTAKGVTVQIEGISGAGGETDGQLSTIKRMHLAWSNSELTNARAEKPPPADIPPGPGQLFDLVHLNSKHSRRAIVDVRPQPVRGDHRNRFADASVAIDLAISGENIDPQRYRVTVTHRHEVDGQAWDGSPTTVRPHLTLTQPERLRG